MVPRSQRIINTALILGLAVALIGGALLFAQGQENDDDIRETAASNSRLICLFGKALNTPIKQRPGESAEDLRRRVKLAREFARVLRSELENCDAQPPPRIRLDPDARGTLHDEKPEHSESAISGEGGGSQTGSTPGQQPAPPAGGGNGNAGPPPGVPPTPPGPPDEPVPDKPGLLDPVTDHLPLECEVNLAGIRVCS